MEVATIVRRRAKAKYYDDVIVLAYTTHGTMQVISSRMTSAEANWMLDYAKEVIVSLAMNPDGD